MVLSAASVAVTGWLLHLQWWPALHGVGLAVQCRWVDGCLHRLALCKVDGCEPVYNYQTARAI